MYFFLGAFSGILGTGLSILMRLELSGVGSQILYGN
jgi:heme/copper-type cytochrome/quinol oxidase subunit 1